METVVIAAVSILAVVFIASFGSLIFICYQKYKQKRQSLLADDGSNLSQTVLTFDDTAVDNSSSNLELGAVITCDDGTIRQLLETEAWANDVHGVIPHCIGILKMCREVTEKLLTVAMDRNQKNIHPSHMSEIVIVAKCISPRVDDVMRSISPPIDAEHLEARSAALIYSVQHLALLVRNAWQSPTSLDWIDAALDNMSQHLKILRSANLNNLPEPDAMKTAQEDTDNDSKLDDDNLDTLQPPTSQESSQL
ncbi:unnamed protein product [Clavelina lepadiformis]|uniref:Transmembrane protein 98 n=1 Tax=Clavelina lepadiformis TaxID=159417 RepID=A0ABP0G7Z1_CLALP